MSSPRIKVAEGIIEGQQRTAFDGKKYYSFEGIPYAKPPVGKLRFRDPQPPEPWTGVKDCTKPGNRCAQMNPGSPSKVLEGSEDCLYLNVYTPCLPPDELAKLPVLFFIHGGFLVIGFSDYYQPDYYMRHDVILVTINYRLNVLGFLSLDIPEVPGNAGLKDCAAALRWVNANISSFNGDPNNITIYGESAGGAICTAFLCSNMTKGLFHKCIAQSANIVADIFMFVQDHVGAAKRLASTLGKDIDDKQELLEFFESVPLSDLVAAYNATKSDKLITPLLIAVVEKEFDGVERFLHEPPLVSFKYNRFVKVPTIAGSNLYEGATFIMRDRNGAIKYDKDLKKYVPNFLYLKPDDPLKCKIARSLKDRYFKDKEIGDDTKMDYVRFLSDTLFNRDITKFAELIAKANDNFYSYKFNFVGNMNVGTMKSLGVHGTTHGDAIQYQFYRERQVKKASKKDMEIVDFFSEAFTNFAKYGKPTWSNQEFEWVPYTTSGKLNLVIDDDKKLVRNDSWECYEYWNALCGDRANL